MLRSKAKTILIHFTRRVDRTSTTPFMTKGETITSSNAAKILGVVMNAELRYTQRIANVATKGLRAAMALRRLRMVSPSTVRQLFGATVTPVLDYASNVRMHACGWKTMRQWTGCKELELKQLQGLSAMSTAIAEAKASIRTIRERHLERATSL